MPIYEHNVHRNETVAYVSRNCGRVEYIGKRTIRVVRIFLTILNTPKVRHEQNLSSVYNNETLNSDGQILHFQACEKPVYKGSTWSIFRLEIFATRANTNDGDLKTKKNAIG